MKLQDYRKLRGLSRAGLGLLVGVTGIQIWRIETGRSMPRPVTVRSIYEESNGAVTADDHSRAFEECRAAMAGKQEGGADK